MRYHALRRPSAFPRGAAGNVDKIVGLSEGGKLFPADPHTRMQPHPEAQNTINIFFQSGFLKIKPGRRKSIGGPAPGNVFGFIDINSKSLKG